MSDHDAVVVPGMSRWHIEPSLRHGSENGTFVDQRNAVCGMYLDAVDGDEVQKRVYTPILYTQARIRQNCAALLRASFGYLQVDMQNHSIGACLL